MKNLMNNNSATCPGSIGPGNKNNETLNSKQIKGQNQDRTNSMFFWSHKYFFAVLTIFIMGVDWANAQEPKYLDAARINFYNPDTHVNIGYMGTFTDLPSNDIWLGSLSASKNNLEFYTDNNGTPSENAVPRLILWGRDDARGPKVGFVGVNTRYPRYRFNIAESNWGMVQSHTSTVGGAKKTTDIGTYIQPDHQYAYLGTKTDTELRLGTNNDSGTMTLKTNGKVGIGTTDPEHHLHVRGGTMIEEGGLQVKRTIDSKVYRLVLGVADNTKKGSIYSDSELEIFAGGQRRFIIEKEGQIIVNGQEEIVAPSKANLNKYNLFVQKGILSEDYAIAPKGSWADHVFKKDYALASLDDVAYHIAENGHLPQMPSEAEVAKNGYDLHEMNTKFLQKIEELTLYTIDQQKKIEALQGQLNKYKDLEARLKALEDN